MKANLLNTAAGGSSTADDVLIRRPEQARLAGGVSVDTIKRWERVGISPPPVELGPRLKAQWRSVWMGFLASRQRGKAA
jgi:hypothetical protein